MRISPNRGHWMLPAVVIILMTVLAPSPTAARITIYNSTGLDGKETSTKSTIKTLCMSTQFYFHPLNVADADVAEYYGNWTQKMGPGYFKTNGRSELGEIGKMFGFLNFDCKFTDGHCAPLPTCEDIADTMGLLPNVEPDQDSKTELRRRYFLALMLDKTMQYYHELDAGMSLALIDVKDMVPNLAAKFAKQKNNIAFDPCQMWAIMEKALLLTAGAALKFAGSDYAVQAALLTFVPLVKEIGTVMTKEDVEASARKARFDVGGSSSDSGDDQEKKQQFLTQGQVRSLFGSSIFTPADWAENEGLFQPGVPQKSVSANPLSTYVYTGMCEDKDFPKLKPLHEAELSEYVAGVFTKFRAALHDTVRQSFIDNAFLGSGRSVLWKQLHSTNWAMSTLLGDDLRVYFQRAIARNVKMDLISQLFRSSQCYVHCLQLDPRASVSDVGAFWWGYWDKEVAEPNAFKSVIFNPEHVRALERGLPLADANLQCKFQCLSAGKGYNYLPEVDTLASLKAETGLDPPNFFTQAVENYLEGLDNQHQTADSPSPYGAWYRNIRLPVCVSKAIAFQEPINPVRRSWITGPEKDYHFPFHCGDWKASETKQFLTALQIEPESPNYKSGGLATFYEVALQLMQHKNITPLTHFLMLCETGHRYHNKHPGFYFFDDYFLSPEFPVCPKVREDVQDMSELEANLWFCFGRTAAKSIGDEINKHWYPGTIHTLGHVDQCEDLFGSYDKHRKYNIPKEKWRDEDYPSMGEGLDYVNKRYKWRLGVYQQSFSNPFGLGGNDFQEIVVEYRQQVESWNKDHRWWDPPMRWNPTNPRANEQKYWTSWPPAYKTFETQEQNKENIEINHTMEQNIDPNRKHGYAYKFPEQDSRTMQKNIDPDRKHGYKVKTPTS